MSITLRLYAERKGIALESVTVELSHKRIYAKDCEDCEQHTGMLDEIGCKIHLTGELDEFQRERLLQIAARCPVHRTLNGVVKIRTVEN
jgi:putative redox protein